MSNLKQGNKNLPLPDLLCIDDVNTGPTAFDGRLVLLQFKRTTSAPQHTTNSTSADEAMRKMTLGFIFWLLFPKSAVIGNC